MLVFSFWKWLAYLIISKHFQRSVLITLLILVTLLQPVCHVILCEPLYCGLFGLGVGEVMPVWQNLLTVVPWLTGRASHTEAAAGGQRRRDEETAGRDGFQGHRLERCRAHRQRWENQTDHKPRWRSAFLMFNWSKFLLYNFLSCLVSHPDETLRKRLKEKRKGGFMSVILLLHSPSPLFAWTSMSHLNSACQL